MVLDWILTDFRALCNVLNMYVKIILQYISHPLTLTTELEGCHEANLKVYPAFSPVSYVVIQ